MDREKVIKKAERIMCSTVDRDMIDSFCEYVIAMLKEQEAMQVQYSAIGGLRYGACPKCNARVDNLVNPKACGFCGQELKWE